MPEGIKQEGEMCKLLADKDSLRCSRASTAGADGLSKLNEFVLAWRELEQSGARAGDPERKERNEGARLRLGKRSPEGTR